MNLVANPDCILCLHRLTSRFFLNLRSIALHQPEVTFETHPTPTISAFHTRRTWQKQGPITTDFFVSLETYPNKSIHTSVTKLNEENIQRTETFDLEVMESQTQYKEDQSEMT